jgi:hypothetical protein
VTKLRALDRSPGIGRSDDSAGLAEALEHFQEWEEESPRTLSEHELAVLSEIVGYELSEAESAEARVLELATEEDSEVGLAERCPTVEEVSHDVMENLDESAGDEDEDEVGLLPDKSEASRQQRKKDFQDLIGTLRSEVSRPEVARLMTKTDPGMTPAEYLRRMEILVARFEDCFCPDFTIGNGTNGKRHVVRIKLRPDAIPVLRKLFRLLCEHTILVQA